MRQLAVLLCAFGLTACLDPGKNITPPLGEDMPNPDMDMAPDLATDAAPDADIAPAECADERDCAPLDNTRATCEGGVCMYTCLDGFKTLPDEQLAVDGCTCQLQQTGACNGADDNCDGRTDEPGEFAQNPCTEKTSGVCMGATRRCEGDATAHKAACDTADYTAHNPLYREQADEDWLCDGEDNDCDGNADEACCVVGMVGRDPKERMPIAQSAGALYPRAHHLGRDAATGRIFSASCSNNTNAMPNTNNTIKVLELDELGAVQGAEASRALPVNTSCQELLTVRRDMNKRNVIMADTSGKLYTSEYHITDKVLTAPAQMIAAEKPTNLSSPASSIDRLSAASIGDDHLITWIETHTTSQEYSIRFMGCKIERDPNRCSQNKVLLREIAAVGSDSQIPLAALFVTATPDRFYVFLHAAGEQPKMLSLAAADDIEPMMIRDLSGAPGADALLGASADSSGVTLLMTTSAGVVASRYNPVGDAVSAPSPVIRGATSAELHAMPTGAIAVYDQTATTQSQLYTRPIDAAGQAAPGDTIVLNIPSSDNLLGIYPSALVPTTRGALLQWSTQPQSGGSQLYALPLNVQGDPICLPPS